MVDKGLCMASLEGLAGLDQDWDCYLLASSLDSEGQHRLPTSVQVRITCKRE